MTIGIDKTGTSGGAPGTDGEDGAPGVPGFPGDDGDLGMFVPGTPGTGGEGGEDGAPGAPGQPGEDGEDGFFVPGAPGDAGAQGGQGTPGAPGQAGEDGDTFFIPGTPGTPGVEGAAGGAGPPAFAVDGDDGMFIPGSPGTAGATGSSVGPFGSGQDGAAVLDGTTTFPWCVLTGGNTYTMLGNVFLTNLTINNGINLRPRGCIIFVQGTLLNNGTIEWNGAAAALAVAGASEASVGPFAATLAGGAGKTNSATSGTAGTGHTGNSGLSPGIGGYGGAGTTVVIGGGAPSNSYPVPLVGGIQVWDAGFPASGFFIGTGTTIRTAQGGGGGGGGGGAASGVSGGGGAGGGIVAIAARTLTNNGTISANGGAGAAASGTGPCGGGGGGGGGVVYLQYVTLTNTGTISALGGAGAAGSGTFVEGDVGTTSTGTASDTDGTLYTHAKTPLVGKPYFIAVMSTVAAGSPEVPTVRVRNDAFSPGWAYNTNITQLGTAVNGAQRLTLFITRVANTAAGQTIEAVFAATQTSCDIMTVDTNVTSASLIGLPNGIIQTVTNTATAATTCVVTLAAEQTDSLTFGFFAVQANVTMTAGAGFTAGTALTNAAPAGQMRHEALAGQDTTVDMTTVGAQSWVGIAVEVQQGKRGTDGAAGRVVQIPAA